MANEEAAAFTHCPPAACVIPIAPEQGYVRLPMDPGAYRPLKYTLDTRIQSETASPGAPEV